MMGYVRQGERKKGKSNGHLSPNTSQPPKSRKKNREEMIRSIA